MIQKIFTSRFFWLAVIFVAYFLVAYTSIDPDFGWHLTSGRYFLNHGIPATDIYTYTASSFPWIDHEWLSDILMAKLYGFGGYDLLAICFAALWSLGVWLAGRTVSTPLLVAGALATLPFAGVRTVTWSFVLLVVLMQLVRAPKWWKVSLVPLFLIWANLHGSFVIGFFVLGYEAVRRRSWRLAILLLTCVATTLINPYGWHVYIEIWRTVSDSGLRGRVVEWAAALFPLVSLPYILAWVGTFVVVDGKKWRHYLGLDTILLLASLLTVRTTPLFIIASMGTVQSRVDRLAQLIPDDLDPHRRRFIKNIGIAGVILVIFMVMYAYRNTDVRRDAAYPQWAVNTLSEHPCHGRLFNDYGYGGFLIWKLPSEKLYIDGRMPSWRNSEGTRYFDSYNKILTDTSFRREQFNKNFIKCVLIKGNQLPFIIGLVGDGWNYTYTGDGPVLLRND